MLGECLEIFGSYTEEKRESDILDHYIPKDVRSILRNIMRSEERRVGKECT